MNRRPVLILSAMAVLLVLLLAASLLAGSVSIPPSHVWGALTGSPATRASWRFIVVESRLPQALAAVLCGAALSVSGLLLQTAFRNPLAGPGIFGITNGAALGVALVLLLLGGSVMTTAFSLSGFMAVLVAAFAGAMAVTLLLLSLSAVVRSHAMLLILGIMVGYLSSSLIALLNFSATEEGLRSYMVWGMGSFAGVSWQRMPVFAALTAVSLAAAVLLVKPLNALLLGERYARSLGVNTRRLRNRLLLVTGLLCAVTTAFCGPVAFIGLAVPHMARLIIRTENHRWLLPTTMLTGALVTLACHLACHLPGSDRLLPLNAVTPLVGAPVIIYVVLSRRSAESRE